MNLITSYNRLSGYPPANYWPAGTVLSATRVGVGLSVRPSVPQNGLIYFTY